MLLLILLLAFFLRAVFVFSESSDSMVHLWLINRQKQIKGFSHKPIQSIINGKQASPSLTHSIVAFFPEKYHKIVGLGFNIFYDLVCIVIVYLVAMSLKDVLMVSAFNDFFLSFESSTALIFATSPILFPVNARLRSLGSRTFGLMWVLVFFSLTGWATLEGSYLPYLVALPVVILIIMSSQFAMQAVLMFSLFYGVVTLQFLPFIVVLVGMLIGYLMPFTGIRHFIKYKINHYIWYFRNYKKGTTAANRNDFREFIRMPYYLMKNPARFFEIWFGENSFLIAAYSLPVFLFLLGSMLSGSIDYQIFLSNEAAKLIAFLFIASFMAFLLTSFRPFLFLGSPERYFEYGTAFLSILFVYALFRVNLDNPGKIFMVLLVIHLTVIFFNLLYLLYKRANLLNNVEDEDFQDVLNFLRNNIDEAHILTIPTKISFGLASSWSNSRVKFYYPFISGDLDGFQYMEQEEVKLYHVKPDLNYFKNTYQINLVVVKNNVFNKTCYPEAAYWDQLRNQRLLYSNEQYSVYQLE